MKIYSALAALLFLMPSAHAVSLSQALATFKAKYGDPATGGAGGANLYSQTLVSDPNLNVRFYYPFILNVSKGGTISGRATASWLQDAGQLPLSPSQLPTQAVRFKGKISHVVALATKVYQGNVRIRGSDGSIIYGIIVSAPADFGPGKKGQIEFKMSYQKNWTFGGFLTRSNGR